MNNIEDIDLKALIERETSEFFNKAGYIRCPFHSEKTPSLKVRFNPNQNKYVYHCFGCDCGGDAIDFIRNYKNMDYLEAREYIGLEVEKTPLDEEKDLVIEYVNNQLKGFRKGQKLLGIFTFVDQYNNPIYYKVKFLKADGKKETPYYHVENGKVIASRGSDEVIYNMYNVINGIANKKSVVIVEGEKDANTINNLLRPYGYVATSIKGCKDLSVLKQDQAKIIVMGDTGEAGDKYINQIKKELFPTASSFKIVTLPGLKRLGNNKDVTDWLEVGHNKNDLLEAIKRSLDLKNVNELQQNSNGIYRTIVKKNDDIYTYEKKYIADFQVLSATRIEIVDEEEEGVRIVFKSCTGAIYERVGKATVFDDLKTFKNYLGTMDLNFLGKSEDLNYFCKWINMYFALENEKIYSGVKFMEIDNKLNLVTNNCAISETGTNKLIKCDNKNKLEVDNVEPITPEELQELLPNLLGFIGEDKIYTILGTVINNLMVKQCENLGVRMHHLLIVGESGSGKSTTLKNVILPLLNMPLDSIKTISKTSAYAFEADLCTGNYTALYDEYKPSMLDVRKNQNISNTLRDLYDRHIISKGNKSLNIRSFKMGRPLVLCGEESYPNSEKANIERSAIVYTSCSDQNDKTRAAINYLTKNEMLIRKLGRSLIDVCLKTSTEDYESIRKSFKDKCIGLEGRPLETAISVCSGIAILNKVIEENNLTEVITDFEHSILENLKAEVLEDSKSVKNVAEQMILLFDEIVANIVSRNNTPDPKDRTRLDSLIRFEEKDYKLYIRTPEMINKIFEHCKIGSAELIPLKLRDFKKQITKSGYMLKSKKQFRLYGTDARSWYDEYSISKIRKLGCVNIAPLSEFEEIYTTKNSNNEQTEQIEMQGRI